MFAGFDVDVRGKILDRLTDQQVHKTNDGGVVIGGVVVGSGGGCGSRSPGSGARRTGALFGEGRGEGVEFSVCAVKAIDRRFECTAFGQHHSNAKSGRGTHIVERHNIAGVDHREGDGIARAGDRDDPVPAAEGRRHESHHRVLNRMVEEFHKWDSNLCSARRDELGRGD